MIRDELILQIASAAAEKSHDPSTKVGAVVIAGPDDWRFCLGRNHIPGLEADSPLWEDRSVKYELVIHAEVDALSMPRAFRATQIAVTHPPCSRCASVIAEAGIKRVLIGNHLLEKSPEEVDRFLSSCRFDLTIFILERNGIGFHAGPKMRTVLDSWLSARDV